MNPGSGSANNGVLEIAAGGWDINGTGDGAHLVYQTIPGNFAATVKVIDMPSNQDWEMGGLDVRLSTDAGSAHACFQTQVNHGMQHKIRATNGSDSAEYDLPNDTAGKLVFPVYLKIRRVDDKISFAWTQDPVKGPIHQGNVLTVPAFKGVQKLLVGPLGCAHGGPDTTDPGFQFANFKVFPIAGAAPAPAATAGDVNGDGKLDIKDATLSLQIGVGLLKPTDAQKAANDVNKDGKLDLKDATLILQAAVGLTKLQ